MSHMTDNYIESEWWALKTRYGTRACLYKGHKVVPYCPRCGTALASHEVAQGYKDVKEISATVRFKCTGRGRIAILAWTTTPWTLPSNVCALCERGRRHTAARQRTAKRLILAKALVEKVLGEDGNTK